MALLTASGSFNINANSPTGQRSITGLGFQPKLVIFHGTMGYYIGAWAEFAAASSPSEQYCAMSDIRAGRSYAETERRLSSNLCWLGNTGALGLNRFDLVSFDSDGFTINVLESHWTTVPHYWTAFGGDIQAKVGVFDLNTVPGQQQVTGVGFQGKLALFSSTREILNSTDGGFCFSLGAASGPNNQFASCAWAKRDGNPQDARRKSSDSRCLYVTTGYASTVPSGEAGFVSFDSDGFTIDVVTATGSKILYVVLGGDFDAVVGNVDQPSLVGQQAVSGLGIEPEYLMMFSSGNTALDTVQDHHAFTIGVASSPTKQQSVGHWSTDNVTTSQVTKFESSTSNIGFIDPSTKVAEASLDSFDSDGFTLDWTTVDMVTRKIGYVALGQASGGPPPFTPAQPQLFVICG